MRWLFLFVLVVNVVYVSWEYSQSADESAAPEANANVPTIKLLSEIGQATKNPTEKTIEAPEPSKAPSSASKPAEQEKEKKKDQSPATTAAAKSGADSCYTLGPFRELDNLREFTRAIKNYVIAASFRSREEQEQSMFWVYIEPSPGLKEAKVLGNQLKNKKIKDYYVISEGPKKNGISLGHFKEKDRAYAHAENIKSLGFKPAVEPVFKSYTIYWLDYMVPGDKVIPQKIYTKHLSKKINRLNRACS